MPLPPAHTTSYVSPGFSDASQPGYTDPVKRDLGRFSSFIYREDLFPDERALAQFLRTSSRLLRMLLCVWLFTGKLPKAVLDF